MLEKIQSRKEAFDEYKDSIARKSVPISMLKLGKKEDSKSEDLDLLKTASKNTINKIAKGAAKHMEIKSKKKKIATKKATKITTPSFPQPPALQTVKATSAPTITSQADIQVPVGK
jgi:hypothetical protein